MKQFTLLCLMILLLSGCESKHTCPICMGEGSVIVQGEEQQCLGCKGEGKLSDEDFRKVCNMLERLRKTYPNTVEPHSNVEPMSTCPFCNGSGVNGAYTCGFCNGVGQVSASAAAQGRHVVGGGSVNDFYPSSSSNSGNGNVPSSSDRSCHSCNGTGDCQHCSGIGVVEYDGQYNTEGGLMKCPVCKGTKRCNVCHGSGHI